jgi:hypothetical protein
MGIYEIFFKSNAKETAKHLSNVSIAVNNIGKKSKTLVSVFDEIETSSKNLNKVMKSNTDVSNIFDKDLSQVSKSLSNSSKKSKEMSEDFKDIINNSPFKSLQRQSDELNEKMSMFRKLSGIDIGPFKAATNQFKALKTAGYSTTQALSGGLKSFMMVGKVAFAGLTKSAMLLMSTLWPLLAIFVAIQAALFIFKKMWNMNFLGMQTTFNKVFGKLRTEWAKFNIAIYRGLKKIEPAFKVLGKVMSIIFKPIAIQLKIIFWLFGVLGKVVWAFVKHLSPIGIMFKLIKASVEPVKKIFEWFKGTKIFEGAVKTLEYMKNLFETIKQIIAKFADSLPDWAKGILGIKEIKLKGAPAVEANKGGNTNNNTHNDNKTITIMTNKAIDKEGANGLAGIISAQSFI